MAKVHHEVAETVRKIAAGEKVSLAALVDVKTCFMLSGGTSYLNGLDPKRFSDDGSLDRADGNEPWHL